MATLHKSKLEKWSLRFPFRLNFWLIVLLLILLYYAGYYFDDQKEMASATAFYFLIRLLLKISFYFLLIITVFSSCSVLFTYLLYQFGKKSRFKSMLNTVEGERQGLIEGHIPFYLKPVLGKLQAVIWYKDEQLKPTFIQQIPTGEARLVFPVKHIRHYEVQELDLLFLDFMRMYRLPASLHSISSFAKHPEMTGMKDLHLLPQKHREEMIHTQKVIYNPGEWLQYKPFESGDDVRRVIWKLYAKSKELMVRQQELYTHYSSIVSIIAVFDMDEYIERSLPEWSLQRLLDAYKNEVYTIYQHLLQSNTEVIFTIYGQGSINAISDVKSRITAASWLYQKSPVFNIPNDSFIVIHSLVPNELIRNLQSRLFRHTALAIIPLLNYLPKRDASSDMWRWLFKEDKDRQMAGEQLLPGALEKLRQKEAANFQSLE